MNARRLQLASWLLKIVFSFAVLFCHQALGQPQVADATRMGEPVSLDQGWRFHAGDDPEWSSADYDDSGWQSFDPDKNVSGQELPAYHGFLWLRIHLRLPPAHGPLSVLLDRAGNSYQVFVNGKPIGNYGSFLSGYGYFLPVPLAFPLADTAPTGANQGEAALLAIRFWRPISRSLRMIGPRTVVIGPATAIETLRKANRSSQIIDEFDGIIVSLLGLLIGFGLIGLYLAQQERREYLWAGISLALIGLYYAMGVLGVLAVVPFWSYEFGYSTLGYGFLIAGIEFLYSFNGQRPGIIARIYQMALLAGVTVGPLAYYGHANGVLLNSAAGAATFSYAVLSAVLLVIWYLRGKREAAILLLPVVLFGLAIPLEFFSYVVYVMGWIKTPDGLIPDLHFGPVHFVFSSLVVALYMLSFVVILGSRFLSTSREQERSAAELAAAHRVQSRLVPVAFPALGAFSIEAAYVAATEVGGDFYQAFPEADGGLLFFLGDVSGKGLSAAMVGTLIVGAIQTLAVQQLSPARALTLLNQQLMGQTDGGFVTCLCARISAAGTMIIANAGHLSPYLDGAEVDLANGLPLGISATIEYVEQVVQVPASGRLTFISDGVVEAKNAQQELLGFARTQQLSVLPAAAIAQAAQTYGQVDDITVVTIQFAPS